MAESLLLNKGQEAMPETATVTVAQGALRGREQTSKRRQTYYSFRGVPYAKPPVGALRFKVSALNPLGDFSPSSTGYYRLTAFPRILFSLLSYSLLD
jgi:hypothetical protein